ncbi:fumarylacetoacetate hydrolase family protein [Alkalicoccus halolimnae]|uniref:Fumarylacetoacetate hydrolase family protein n=1 Tax=Alkalicoccus halolimnae TaxID=1667239 RepID=A0A5C7FEK6_9BACI|nr:fumarylacetoacetate hydrolase family protein [Alkalicoccus halolimnae]TXF84001.1 fumarylacetoacetate hydrolase family protein [Alkalicoccus halolimnae]
MDVKNIYCVGRNYQKHAAELGDKVPDEPMLFSKPTHALAHGAQRTLHFPGNRGSVHYEAELVVRFKAEWFEGADLNDLIDGVACGIDFTLREEQEKLKGLRYPWLTAKGFPQSAAVGPFYSFEPGKWEDTEFTLHQNGELKQQGSPKDMMFSLKELAAYAGRNLGLGRGDLLFTGTPEGVGPVSDGDELKLAYNGREAGTFTVHLFE